ncbi:MAG: type II secretion system F family protein [Chloroflexi bacterium]|nr:type II secretion system F family protein [Chloroflexota bacterium]
MLPLVALSTAGFVFTLTLWVAGFGAAGMTEATARLNRIRNADGPLPQGPSSGGSVGLRKRTAVNFGGLNLVSGKLATSWAQDLERAGLTLNVREYFVLRLVIGLVAAALGMSLLPVPQLGLVAAPLGYLLVGVWVRRRIASRRRKLESQLVEMLQMLSSGLRAGFGLQQSLDAAAEQLPAPLTVELRRTMRDMGMGASIEQALTALNERIGSPDFDIVITAMLIQRAVGGNLAEILENVAHTMRERERIKGEIRTLTSQQRMTGYVIGGIPVGLTVVFFLISPEFISLLFTDKLGHMMVAGAVVLETMGFLVIRKIVNIEV